MFQRILIIVVCFFSLVNLPGCRWSSKKVDARDVHWSKVSAQIEAEQLWAVDVGRGVTKQATQLVPVIHHNRIFAADASGQVSAYELDEGKRLWKTNLSGYATSAMGAGHGLVLVGTAEAELVALSCKTGEVVWKAALSNVMLAKPRVKGNRVLTQTLDGMVSGFDINTGRKAWQYQHTFSSELVLQHHSTPALHGNSLLAAFADGRMVNFSVKKGEIHWELSPVKRRYHPLDGTTDGIFASPVVSHGKIYMASYQSEVVALDLHSRHIDWRKQLSVYLGITVDSHSLFTVDTDNIVWRLDRASGRTMWKQNKMAHHHLSTKPVMYGNTIIVGDDDGYLYWIGKSNGQLIGRIQVDHTGIASTPILLGDRMFVMVNDGGLFAYRLTLKS